MMLTLERYDLNILYTPGKEIYIADTLSRAPEEIMDINRVEMIVTNAKLAVLPERLKRLQKEIKDDVTCNKIKELNKSNKWPKQNKMDHTMKEFYSIRNSIIGVDDLLYKDNLLIIPESLRNEMLKLANANNGGVGACLISLREVMYWPGISKEMKNLVEKCTCRKLAENNK